MVASGKRDHCIVDCDSESHATLRHSYAERMRSYSLIFVAFATVLFCIKYINAAEICLQENCVTTEKCEEPINANVYCKEQGTICCSIVKSEHRTHCRHHGGECMKKCAAVLQHDAVDCQSNEVCCVLI